MSTVREQIKDMIFRMLTEAEEFVPVSAENMTTASRLSAYSIDSQIDSYILGFENESAISQEEKLSEMLSTGSLSLLLEADPEEIGDAPEEDPPEDAPGEEEEEPAEEEDEEEDVPEPGDESDMKATDATESPKMPINVEIFTDKVMRLAMNSEQMLDMKGVIINRARKFLVDNYDKKHLESMDEFLDTNYDLNRDGDDTPAAPFGLGANPAGAGSMGGGGG